MTVGLIALAAALLNPGLAFADEVVYCPPDGGDCVVIASTEGSDDDEPAGSGGSSTGDCGGMPCFRTDIGWWSPTDKCYYRLAAPQPPVGHPAWQGHQPGDGGVYLRTCANDGGALPVIESVWLADPPPGYGGLPSPAVLAAQAISRLPIRGPDIGLAPDPNGSGLVGLPVWMWTSTSPQTWGPASATASVPGLSVTATARARQIVWQMGDGESVVCRNSGTPYKPSFGNTESPTCGHRYARPGEFAITATTTWHVTWVGGGASGELDVTRQSTATIDVNELQVVTE